MKFRIDLHMHSKHSGDTYSEPEEMVTMAIEAGLHGIAFTEHYFYGATEHVEGLREKFNDRIMILRGVEFSAAEGHCLIFGIDTDSLPIKNASLHDITPLVHEHGGVVIPSHPFRGSNSVGEELFSISDLDAVEGYNGLNMHSLNMRAVEAAEELSVPVIGGSDAHMPEDVGSCFTEFNERVTYDNFIDLLRAGDYKGVDTRKISRGWNFFG